MNPNSKETKEKVQKKIRHIEIKSNRLVNEGMGGKYQSTFKGRGMEFAEVREYMPGDDIRTIDWNVTARQKKPFVKVFTEEREMTVIFLIDMSSSLSFGSVDQSKVSLAAEVVSVLAFSAIKNNDRVGMLSFTDKIEKVLRPKKGRNNILRMVNDLLEFQPEGVKTSLSVGLKAINEIWRKKALVFLLSDFKDTGYEKDLLLTAKRHDLICINISDPREKEMPKLGMIDFYDAENDEIFTIDTSSKKMMDLYKKQVAKHEEEKKDIFRKAFVDVINISTDSQYDIELAKFFATRQKRKMLG